MVVTLEESCTVCFVWLHKFKGDNYFWFCTWMWIIWVLVLFLFHFIFIFFRILFISDEFFRAAQTWMFCHHEELKIKKIQSAFHSPTKRLVLSFSDYIAEWLSFHLCAVVVSTSRNGSHILGWQYYKMFVPFLQKWFCS